MSPLPNWPEFLLPYLPEHPPAVFAPMVGFGDSPMRRLVRRFGSPWVTSELISAAGLAHGSFPTHRMLRRVPEEEPLAIQLFAADGDTLERAMDQIEGFDFLFIEINAGCPVPIVVKVGGGSALLRNLVRMEEVLRRACARSNRITLKYRLGWSPEQIVACEVAQLAEDCGVRMLTLHARTRDQAYGGVADWSRLAEVRAVTHLPLIGNGDVRSGEDAVRMIRETGCDGVMIARGALGRPWLFAEVNRCLAEAFGGTARPVPDYAPWDILEEHLRSMLDWYGDRRALLEMRKHVVCYLHGIPGASRLREESMKLETSEELTDWLKRLREELPSPGNWVSQESMKDEV